MIMYLASCIQQDIFDIQQDIFDIQPCCCAY